MFDLVSSFPFIIVTVGKPKRHSADARGELREAQRADGRHRLAAIIGWGTGVFKAGQTHDQINQGRQEA